MNNQQGIDTAHACGAQVASNAEPAQPAQPVHQQIKLALDVHAGDVVVDRMVDGAKPQPPQKMTTARFLEWAAKQKAQAREVISCYEAEPTGFWLHRQLTALGVRNYVVCPTCLDERYGGVNNDRTDALELRPGWMRNRKLIETTATDFLVVLARPEVSVHHYLRRLHNLALGLGWISSAVLPSRLWPKVRFKEKRAITRVEHERILQAERNPERNLYYQLLWEIGASQSDAAELQADQIDWKNQTLSYRRKKTGEWAQIMIGNGLKQVLKQLPTEGALFPAISQTSENDRSAEFYRRCKLLGIQGISLHSYRYAWAQSARSAGYPERFAQGALGHGSKAVHRAYARGAHVMLPSLEAYENLKAAGTSVPAETH